MTEIGTADDVSAERRTATYRLLSAAFRRPTEELFARLEETDSDEVLVAIDTLREARPDIETVRLDHAQLFVGPFEVAAPPYGSTYIDDPGRVMTESTAEVEEWFRREGLDIGLDEPPDHVAAELEFVGVLALAEREASDAGETERARTHARKQYEFLSGHLGRWISELADNVRDHAETEFYRTLAEETQAFVEEDGRRLAQRLGEQDETDDVRNPGDERGEPDDVRDYGGERDDN